jgi:diguanylate cyclase (GGDEF)-like protein
MIVNENRKIISFNRRLTDIWKIPLADLETGDDELVLAVVTSSVKDAASFAARVTYLYDHPGESSQDEIETTDGRFLDRHTVTLNGPGGDYLGRVWYFRDITPQKQAEALAIRMARCDVLTGLANRVAFVEQLQHAIAKAKHEEKSFALIYLDLDHFKDVNDTLGHPVGDAFLKAIADRLGANAREADFIARFGGDEFAMIATDIGEPADAAILAENLLTAIADPFSIDGNQIHSGASVGIDLYGPEASDAETLLSHAEVALYRAKSEGRGTYRFFTESMDAEVRERVTLGTELREAITSGQLSVLYQPQVTSDAGRIIGLEALVRWRHPTRGLLRPDYFIRVAEKTGSIVKLGEFVLKTACRQAKAWRDAGFPPVRMSVNVSPLQFKTPLGLENEVAAVLKETGLPSQFLELELTETTLMDVSHDHNAVLDGFRHIGITIAIDDFGTGYSSLDYLRRYPVDRIKVAQNFVKYLTSRASDAAIVKATIGLARDLNIAVIAEGVETREQLELLRGWGCGEIQGFYFSKPLPADEVTRLFQDGGIVTPAADRIDGVGVATPAAALPRPLN